MNKMTKIYISILSLFCSMVAFAQNDKGKTDDIGRIVLTPYVVSNADIPSYAKSVVENKLAQIATRQGMAGSSADMRFVITANLIEFSKEITATAPPMVALKLTPTFYIGDIVTGELFSSCELPTIKGVGENETKAYLSAVNAIRTNHPAIIQCINEGKEKIIEYYNSQIDFIIDEAESMAQSQKFDEAMVKLAAVPKVCKEAYAKAYEKIGEVYQKKIDLEGDKLYNEAYATWNTDKSKESATKVVELLAKIDPISTAKEKGTGLIKTIEKYYAEQEARKREIEERNWEFEVRQYEDEQDNKLTEAKMKYEIEMEKAKNSNGAAEYALQEVKSIVSVMSNKEEKEPKSKNKIIEKIKSWFK